MHGMSAHKFQWKNCGHHTCMHQRRSSCPSQNNLSPKPQVTPKTATRNNQLHPITLAWLRVTKRLIKLRKSQTQAQIVSTYAQVSIVLNAAGPTRYPLKPTEQDPQIVWWFNLSLSLSLSLSRSVIYICMCIILMSYSYIPFVLVNQYGAHSSNAHTVSSRKIKFSTISSSTTTCNSFLAQTLSSEVGFSS